MFGLAPKAPAPPRDFAACSGCGLCVLVCPMWRGKRDLRFTPEGLAKALQCGARATQLAEVLDACALCGACDPVCPERIDLSGLVMHLRRQLPAAKEIEEIGDRPRFSPTVGAGGTAAPRSGGVVFLPGPELRNDSALLARVQALLGLTIAEDDGADIGWALEAGVEIPPRRLHEFLASLRGQSIVAADGLLLRQLRRWLPGSKRMGLGAALSSRPAVRANLDAGDLYVIEPRAYHGDYERMVGYYDRLRIETGCSLNLDLQRIAIPAVGHGPSRKPGFAASGDDVQPEWIIRGRKPVRIVVESLADRAAFARVCEQPVVHLAELGEDPSMIRKMPHAFG